MEHLTTVLFDIFLIFASAKLLGELFERLRQPAVVGEVLAGLLLGPYLLGVVPHSPIYEGIAEIGVIFLLFTVGLETKPSDIMTVGAIASKVGMLGIVLPFALGYGLIAYLGHPTLEALFIGTALVATSVGITARVLGDMGLIQEIESRIILGAAVIDDIIGMILLAIVSGLGEGALSWVRISVVALEAIGFTLFLALVGSRVINRYGRWIERIKTPQAPLVFSILICLGLSALSSAIGMAA
ncbi:MAG TPA: cation:proton antiporter, partial [Candidatus Methylomirabilis sp.]|nr:cation:proton antiporter [Candidatus Methylomirabilis sp.]